MKLTPLTALALAACSSAPTTPVVDPLPPPEPPIVASGGAFRPALTHLTLANGLAVYLLPDAGAPLVCVQVWVGVGSVDEHEGPRGPGSGITGLSHFFEHLMFQGTARYPSYDLALAPLGAKNNAFTYQDATVYWAYTPKEHLGLILDIEADRFANMKVDFVHLEPEREVVKSERRQNVDADPGELAEERVIKRTFDRFPYRWGPIGWMEDLDAIPLETAQRYHAEHYTTTGAYLVIAGDFDPADAERLVAETWGKLERPATAPNDHVRKETLPLSETWVGPRHDHILRPVSQPIVFWSYRAPAPSGPTLRDYVALELIDHALTAGKAGRLGKKLVFTETPRVSNLWARLTPLRHPFAYVWRADLLPGVTTAEVERVLDEELAAIRAHGLDADELAQAVASLRADAIRTNLSNSDKAETIGFSIASTGSPFSMYERLEAYPTITQDEIKAAVATWLLPERRARVVVVSPDRLSALAEALGASDLAAGPLEPLLAKAGQLFSSALDLRDQRAELEREARAIALLKQRADLALRQAATRADKAAIRAYLDDNEMGASLRGARLKEQDATLTAAEAALANEQTALLAALERAITTSRADLARRPVAHAVALLASPLDRHVEVPAVFIAEPRPGQSDLTQRVPLAEGIDGARQLALQVIAAFALEARGLHRSADDARNHVLALGPGLLSKELDQRAAELARHALELAADSDLHNVELSDLPLATVKPTTPRRPAP